jgi:hypothetical protein
MLSTYVDGPVVARYFEDAAVVASWVATMSTLKSLGVIEKYDLIPVAYFPENAVVTS